jgi:hypothetical protein
MKIIKTKFLCKNSSQSGRKSSLTIPDLSLFNRQCEDRFIKGKWYDGEYETWNYDRGYEINGGWRRYWVINEKEEKEEIHRFHMNVIFEMDLENLRDNKINEILKKDE